MFKCGCVKCGEHLTDLEVVSQAIANQPLCCPVCEKDVSQEAQRRDSMWPSTWYGHCTISHKGDWRYFDVDGQMVMETEHVNRWLRRAYSRRKR